MSIPRDVQEFLDGYPNNSENPSRRKNLQFYSNESRCQPDGFLIEELFDQWEDDYDTLEYEHGYIQWLFPIREYGMNGLSQPLEQHEIQEMKASPEVMGRVMRSYKMMLSFYGMSLLDEETGLLDRSEYEIRAIDPQRRRRSDRSRYLNLIKSPHNYLRISRILKHLSEMGLEHLNAGFLLFVLYEQSSNGQLNTPYLRSSMDRWWANCIRNERERLFVRQIIGEVRSKAKKFTKDMYHGLLEGRRRTGALTWDDPATTKEVHDEPMLTEAEMQEQDKREDKIIET